MMKPVGKGKSLLERIRRVKKQNPDHVCPTCERTLRQHTLQETVKCYSQPSQTDSSGDGVVMPTLGGSLEFKRLFPNTAKALAEVGGEAES
jgi:hypothetical protein